MKLYLKGLFVLIKIDFTKKLNNLYDENNNITDFKLERREKIGMHKKKKWFKNKNGELALFKPDTKNNESAKEIEAANIAKELNIPHADVKITRYKNKIGTLSYNVKTKENVEYITFSDYVDEFLGKDVNLSLETVQKHIPEIEIQTVEMLLYDNLINNTDRHGSNWELMFDRKNGKVLGLCPLFDHGNAFDSYAQTCKLRRDDNDKTNINHDTMFKKICKEYPAQTEAFMNKVNSNDYIKRNKSEFANCIRVQLSNMKTSFESVNINRYAFPSISDNVPIKTNDMEYY
jgi:hypothetical protein